MSGPREGDGELRGVTIGLFNSRLGLLGGPLERSRLGPALPFGRDSEPEFAGNRCHPPLFRSTPRSPPRSLPRSLLSLSTFPPDGPDPRGVSPRGVLSDGCALPPPGNLRKPPRSSLEGAVVVAPGPEFDLP